MKPDKTLHYMLGPDRRYEDWVWGENQIYSDWFDVPFWIEFEGCYDPDCCGDASWEVNRKTEEEFEEYLNSFPEDEVMSL